MSLVAKKWLSDFETSLKSGNFNALKHSRAKMRFYPC